MKYILFFDGICGLCHRLVSWLLRVDKKKLFQFAPLEGETAKKLQLKEDSIVLAEDWQSEHPHLYVRSRAIFRIFWHLGGFWRLIGWMAFLPAWLLDPFYRFIANRRYRFFGKLPHCPLPPPDIAERFLP